MGNQLKTVQLNPAEAARFSAFSDACRERAKGFSLGMETAKQMFVEQLIAAREPVKENPDGER